MKTSSRVARLSILLFTTIQLTGCGSDTSNENVDAGQTVDANVVEPTTFPSRGMSEPEKLAIAAIRMSSCIPDDSPQSWIRSHYLHLSPDRGGFDIFTSAAVDCLASASDGCESVGTCTGLTFDLMGPCETSCNGELFTTCDDQWRFQLDCSFSGLSCDASRGCIDATATACTGGDITCEAGIPTGCSGGNVRQGYACADYGLSCDSASPTCTGTAGTCDSGGSSSYGVEAVGISCANENELNACVNGGQHLVRCFDISSGLKCQTREGESFCGLGNECDAFTNGSANCDGTSLVMCNAGRTTTIDCVAAGFAGCSLGGRSGAYCSPAAWNP